MSKRSRSSQYWLSRQRKDEYARRARDLGYVSRAHFKLEQLDRRFKLLSGVRYALELGGAPGGWTSFIEDNLLAKGKLITVDPLDVQVGQQTVHIRGYAGTESVDSQIFEILNGMKIDIVLSDMAPNISGIKEKDQSKAAELNLLVLKRARALLKKKGDVVVKSFQNPDLPQFKDEMEKYFDSVRIVKPPASRKESSEVYLVGQGF